MRVPMQDVTEMKNGARKTVSILPAEHVGKAVLAKDGTLFNGSDEQLAAAMEANEVVFHEGRICGAWPQIVER